MNESVEVGSYLLVSVTATARKERKNTYFRHERGDVREIDAIKVSNSGSTYLEGFTWVQDENLRIG